MLKDWLFQVPSSDDGVAGAHRQVKEQLDRDPVAREISDDEAEAFFAVAYVLQSGDSWVLAMLSRNLRLSVGKARSQGYRRSILRMLRLWGISRHRRQMEFMVSPNCWKQVPRSLFDPDEYTPEVLAREYQDGYSIVLIVRTMRHLGRSHELPAFLERLGGDAAAEYRLYLDVARLMIRRIVHRAGQEVAQPDQPAGAAHESHESLTRKLRAHDSALRSLAGDVDRARRDRDHSHRMARRTEMAARQMLERARADVATAGAELERRLAAQQQELADVAARHRARVAELERTLAERKLEHARTLAERSRLSGAVPLWNRTVEVSGDPANRHLYRTLVESAGGRLVESGGEIRICLNAPQADAPGAFCDTRSGLGAFERVLARQVLPALERTHMR